MAETESRLDVDGTEIAVRHAAGKSPGFIWLGGYRSDMDGTKAQAMVAKGAAAGLATTRFDYSGHGRSGGRFEDGTISLWTKQALAVLERCTEGPQILLGSSMGAWVALRLVQLLRESGQSARVGGLLLLAPAPDFTSKLMEPHFTDEQRAALARDGFLSEPSEYSDEPNIYTAALIEDGRASAVMKPGLHVGAPVHIIQGLEDPDVPHAHARELASLLVQDEMTLTFVKDGDHRLSRPEDIALLERAMDNMTAKIASD